MAKRHHKKRSSKQYKKGSESSTRNNISAYKKDVASSASEVQCPSCRAYMQNSKHLSGLAYCPKCSLFTWNNRLNTHNLSLETILIAIRDISDNLILFQERIVGLIGCINPKIPTGYTKILHQLTQLEQKKTVLSICNDSILSYDEVIAFVKKNGFDESSVVEVFNALRKALNQQPVPKVKTDIRSHSHTKIIFFNVSPKEVERGDKVNIHWEIVSGKDYKIVLSTHNKTYEINTLKDVITIPVETPQQIRLDVLYKDVSIDSKSIQVNLKNLPTINYIQCLPQSAIMETEEVTVKWSVDNADKITLVRKFTEYEQISIDVTKYNGMFKFIAQRNELIEILAERSDYIDKRNVTIDVIPLPKFKVNEIPKLINMGGINEIKPPLLTSNKNMEDLFIALKKLSCINSDLKPYISSRAVMCRILGNCITGFKNKMR